MFAEDTDWLKGILNNRRLPGMLEKTGTVTVVPVDSDLNGATMGQAWLILKGVPELAPSMTDALSFRANCVAMKLQALRYHRRRYEEIRPAASANFHRTPI